MSPIHPNITAPIGLKAKVEQKVRAEKIAAVYGSDFGKKAHLVLPTYEHKALDQNIQGMYLLIVTYRLLLFSC
ncbi:hypothetical protein [Candidatus Rickettsia colombianensi]|uniref:hypothetical protein n=1 Tax=Candidatus Rickettsia colombianensi TaxID=1090944 RepID=UPI00319E900F